jgi:hypothetical protein
LPWTIFLSTSRRFFLLAHLERDVSATSSVDNAVIVTEDLYHPLLFFLFPIIKISRSYLLHHHHHHHLHTEWVRIAVKISKYTWFESQVGPPAALIEVLRGFPQFLQENAEVVTALSLVRLIPFHHCTIIHHLSSDAVA